MANRMVNFLSPSFPHNFTKNDRKDLKMGCIDAQLDSNHPSPEQGILVVWAFFFLNSSMESAKNSYRVVGR
jgi:hypothetical protein